MTRSAEPDPESDADALVRRLLGQQATLVALARQNLAASRSLDDAFYELAQASARTLGVERVSVWMLSDDRAKLECRVLHEQRAEHRSGGTVLSATDYPRYFAALEGRRALDAHDACADPRTSEFREGYLVPLGITSMMDAAIRLEGKVVGVVCHEHVGPRRVWTTDEVAFAGAIADQAALVLAEAGRRALEEERERIAQVMLQAQKLESLGLLAGGVAHDFNNLLTVILGNAALAKAAPDAEQARHALDELIRAAQHAAHLTRQLLAYSGGAPLAFEAVGLAEQARQITELLRPSLPTSLRVVLSFPEQLPAVRADAAQIQQVLMNLVLNAAEASGDRPCSVTISARVREVAKTERVLPGGEIAPGRYVELAVRDEGSGISAADMSRIFDPFFSTKGVGRGLGLAAVLGIARAHGGALAVESRVGEGTSVRFLLPVTGAKRAERQFKVLVVDDQRGVRVTTAHLLRDLGYQVLEAGSGAEALEIYQSTPGPIDVVLLDMTMPDQSGRQTFDALRAKFSNACVLMMSGYDEREATEGLLERGLAGFLQKPFTAEQLQRALSGALSAHQLTPTVAPMR